MKSLVLRKDEHKTKSHRDLLVADVVFDDGTVGVAYLNRSTAERLVFEMEHVGKVMSQKDFEDYKDLVRQECETERSFEEVDHE